MAKITSRFEKSAVLKLMEVGHCYNIVDYWLNSETPNEEVPLLSTCAPAPPPPPMLPKNFGGKFKL